MPSLDDYLTQHAAQFEADLCELLRIKSISADSAYRAEIRKAAEWVAGQFRDLNFQTELAETPGHPIIFAHSPPVAGAATVLVYGHYDVQPARREDGWSADPFDPVVRDGNVYARGATDDKGQMLTHVLSARAWLQTAGRLPVNLKFLIEGEEEVGSANLEDFIRREARRLDCDIVVISDTSQFAPGVPAITYGLRGLAYFEMRLTGPREDKHSGVFGGAVSNPANAVARLLAALIDDRGRIQVPGFYDDVVPLTDAERAAWRALPFDEEAFRAKVGAAALVGEEGYTTLERRWGRPTCDVNGLWGGYQGEGSKTVLPARAGAKFSFRLVPRQDPQKIRATVECFLRERCPKGIELELIYHSGAPGVVVPLDSPYVAAAQRAIERGFGRPPVMIREGGTIPVGTLFKQILGVDTLFLGWGLDDDNAHGPNEKFCLADFHRGIRASAALWEELTDMPRAVSASGGAP
jgi:acetylornithine deacetylase/succinyl-diaminopimelate desuccinylase-like protein